MKANFSIRAFLLVGLSFALNGLAAAQIPTPREGYWVTETNLKQPKITQVRYYNANHELLHEQQITGKKVNIKRPQTVKQLNNNLTNVLNQPLLADRMKAN